MAITNFASTVFGSSGGGELIPRQKFNFTLQLQRYDQTIFNFYRVSSVTAPSYSVDGQLMNQYNKKRFVQTRLNYDPMTVVFYDTFDSEWHTLMRDYIAHYFNGGMGLEQRTLLEGSSTVDPNFETDFGFTPAPDRYFFPEIRVIQNGFRQQYRTHVLKNPHILNVQGDTLDYSDSNPVMYTVSFQPESVQTFETARHFDDGLNT